MILKKNFTLDMDSPRAGAILFSVIVDVIILFGIFASMMNFPRRKT